MQSFMARMARLVVPGIPHHVTQRGNGRASTFFSEGDHALYRALLAEHCAAAGVEVWAWVLMPGHVRLILAPSGEDGLRAALARTHRRYAGHIHAREKRTGHFWQGRFGCVAMDEAHLAAVVCHVALNPVRARLVDRAQDWLWSSVHVHLGLAADDGVTTSAPVMERFPDLTERIAAGEKEAMTRGCAGPSRSAGRSATRRSSRRSSARRAGPWPPHPRVPSRRPIQRGAKCTVTGIPKIVVTLDKGYI
jgi:putative transposase